jgi:tetratricopeptide (TPR) repeat protein/DNA-binding XRE family transcriptional regulator
MHLQRNESLRRLRIQRNWRIADLADQLGTTSTTVKRWERGSQQPSMYYRVKLCELFGVDAEELGFETGPSPSPLHVENEENTTISDTDLTEQSTLWTVPYIRNPYFTGREDLLAKIDQRLMSSDTGKPELPHQFASTPVQALTGLGGIGKTQVAVEYAYRAFALERYSYVLWITAANEETLLASFTALAERLPTIRSHRETDQHKLATAIVHWMERCKQPWLLIFDNVDDLSFIQPYLPRSRNGKILLTTRVKAVGSLASPIEVETMGMEESVEFLLRRAQRFDNAPNSEIDEAGHLVKMLGQLPLALDQAGAYLEETGCSIHDYLQLCQQDQYTLLARRGMQATGYPEAVSTTWSLSFQRLEQTDAAAADLLRLCAFLAPDHIPEEFLSAGAAYWPAALQAAVSDPLRFNQMIEALLRFSLVKRLVEDHLLSLHRLVQAVQRERLEPEEQRQWVERLIRAVHSVFPRDPADPTTIQSQCQRYLEQAQVCDTWMQEYQMQLPEGADVLDRTGVYLRECALYAEAEPLFLRALHMRERLLGTEHPDTAETLNNLAVLYSRQGQYTQAEPLYQRTLSIRERQLGAEHPDTADTINNLAILYYQQGNYKQSEAFHLQALRIREQQLGPEHYITAESLNNLAALYYQQVRYEEIEPLLLRALRIHERQWGLEHPDVAPALHNLANLYRSQRKYELAEPLYQRVLHIYSPIEHPHLVWPLYGLANLYTQQGRYEEAEPLFQRALFLWEQKLGSNHPDMAYPLYGLAILYGKQGQETEAEALFQRALHIREQQVGTEHAGVATILHDFADFLHARGRVSEATAMYQRALTIREHALGTDHPLTAETRTSLQRLRM